MISRRLSAAAANLLPLLAQRANRERTPTDSSTDSAVSAFFALEDPLGARRWSGSSSPSSVSSSLDRSTLQIPSISNPSLPNLSSPSTSRSASPTLFDRRLSVRKVPRYGPAPSALTLGANFGGTSSNERFQVDEQFEGTFTAVLYVRV